MTCSHHDSSSCARVDWRRSRVLCGGYSLLMLCVVRERAICPRMLLAACVTAPPSSLRGLAHADRTGCGVALRRLLLLACWLLLPVRGTCAAGEEEGDMQDVGRGRTGELPVRTRTLNDRVIQGDRRSYRRPYMPAGRQTPEGVSLGNSMGSCGPWVPLGTQCRLS